MFFYILGFLIFYFPTMWVKYTFAKHNDVLPKMPFTGKEFGNNLLKEKKLDSVKIEETSIGDHYDTESKKVKVEPDRLERKSITSIAIICHEIGHALQDKENYKPLMRRQILIRKTAWIQSLGSGILYIGIPTLVATGVYPFIRICLFIVVGATLIRMLIHFVTLEVELDASFKRAMPILEEKLPSEYHGACKSILRVAAFTYVIGAMTSIINFRNIWWVFKSVSRRKIL